MGSKNAGFKLSDEIAYILTFLRSVKQDYSYNREQLSIYDRKTSDFNHSLELDNLNYSEGLS